MLSRIPLLAAVLLAFSATGCCKACSAVKGIAKEIQGPEAAEGERLVKEKVINDKDLRKQICGVDTRELTNLVVKQNPNGHYAITGTPIEKPLAKPSSSASAKPSSSASAKPSSSASAKPIVNGAKTLECVAVISLLWDAKEDSSGTVWSIHKVFVEEISTPGAEYKRPQSGDWD